MRRMHGYRSHRWIANMQTGLFHKESRETVKVTDSKTDQSNQQMAASGFVIEIGRASCRERV